MNEIGLLVVIGRLYLAFWVYARNLLTFRNQVSILRDAATFGIAAWGATLIIVAGEIDISVGPTVAFLSVCFAYILKGGEIPTVVAFLVTIGIGAALGSIAGVLRALFQVPSFIGTLGAVERSGWARLVYDGLGAGHDPSNDTLDRLGGEIVGVPCSAIVMLALLWPLSLSAVGPPLAAQSSPSAATPAPPTCRVSK